jgi:hypothetical protein
VKSFLALWDRKGYKQALAIIKKEYGGSKDLQLLLAVYRRYRGEIRSAMRSAMRLKRRRGKAYWLHEEADYAYIRKLHRLDRIRVMGGNLLKSTSMRGIGDTARKLGIKIRSVYTSNAEEFWAFPPSFKQNFINLPMDEKSVILRTRHSSKYGPRLGSYVYVVHGGLHMQRLMKNPRTKGLWSLMRFRRAGRPGFFTIGIPVR